jgi:hypothetical protein
LVAVWMSCAAASMLRVSTNRTATLALPRALAD